MVILYVISLFSSVTRTIALHSYRIFFYGPDDFVCDQLNMIEQAERIFFYIDAGLMELLALNCIWAQDKGIGRWRFNCIMSFPWRPILSGMFYAFTLTD